MASTESGRDGIDVDGQLRPVRPGRLRSDPVGGRELGGAVRMGGGHGGEHTAVGEASRRGWVVEEKGDAGMSASLS